MKKIYLLIFIVLISSCYENNEKETIIKETWNIINSYIDDTLEWTIKDARDVVNTQNLRNKRLEDNIINNK